MRAMHKHIRRLVARFGHDRINNALWVSVRYRRYDRGRYIVALADAYYTN